MDAESKIMTFLPGEDPGGYALGVDHRKDLSDLAAYKLRLAKMPAGDAVADRFPWWRRVTEVVPAGEQFTLRRPGWGETFQNMSNHLVDIDEIRFVFDWGRSPQTGYQAMMYCKLGIPPRREIVADWTPIMSLHTEIDRNLLANVDSFTYELPAAYVLQRGHPFLMDVRYDLQINNVPPDQWAIMIGLHGYGLHDGEPISLMKPVRGWPYENGNALQSQPVTFEEEQGRAMRDAVIKHISFGSALTDNHLGVLDSIAFRPQAPEGPPWHQSEFFRIRDIAEQIGRVNRLLDEYCIHRPIQPYTLLQGERLNVELWNSTTADVTVDIILRGSQARRV